MPSNGASQACCSFRDNARAVQCFWGRDRAFRRRMTSVFAIPAKRRLTAARGLRLIGLLLERARSVRASSKASIPATNLSRHVADVGDLSNFRNSKTAPSTSASWFPRRQDLIWREAPAHAKQRRLQLHTAYTSPDALGLRCKQCGLRLWPKLGRDASLRAICATAIPKPAYYKLHGFEVVTRR